jgi:urocanate hydratase
MGEKQQVTLGTDPLDRGGVADPQLRPSFIKDGSVQDGFRQGARLAWLEGAVRARV